MMPMHIAVIGAGPVGLALALLAARTLPHAQISLFDARPADRDVAADARTLALALGSIQLLERVGAWDGRRAEPIHHRFQPQPHETQGSRSRAPGRRRALVPQPGSQ